jgi:Zn-dependent M28 family amino/carboxypeptidase
VAAYLPGATSEYVIVGAHFDHIGMGEQSSMSPDLAGKAIHHGADDNASGTAGLLELARWAKQQPKRKRGILFLGFSGEELGLLGSAHYVNQPLLPLDRAVAMINMDMIGRIKDGKVFVGGTNTGDSLKALIEGIQPKTNLKLELSDQGGFGSSDHFSFITKQVPVLFFFSGLHQDYHRPSDTWEKINAAGAVELLSVVAQSIESLTELDRPKFVRVSAPGQQATASASNRGYGAYFGSVPDMSSSGEGFRLSDVNDGSPAQKAGLKGGDVIVEFDGKTIKNLYDFTYALQARKPGDEVVIKYKRDGQERETKATLAVRKR